MTKYLTLERMIWLAAIIALLILLNHCGNTGAATADRLTDSLRVAEKRAHDTANLRQFRYGLDSARYAQAVSKARDSSIKAWDSAKHLQARIRALVGRKTAPDDDIGSGGNVPVVKDSMCCVIASALADQVDTLHLRDSLKDKAFNEQLTLASGMVNAQAQLLQESHDRFNQLDSVYIAREEANRPRGSVWLGAKGAVGPVGSAGVYGKYMTPRGKAYGLGVSRQPTGFVYEGMVEIKLSFRRR